MFFFLHAQNVLRVSQKTRYDNTKTLEKIADNLIFYGPEKMSGGPLAKGMLIRGLEKKKPRGKPKTKK